MRLRNDIRISLNIIIRRHSIVIIAASFSFILIIPMRIYTRGENFSLYFIIYIFKNSLNFTIFGDKLGTI